MSITKLADMNFYNDAYTLCLARHLNVNLLIQNCRTKSNTC